MPISNVSFQQGDQDVLAAERRRKLADALQAQSMQPIETGVYGGMVAPMSWTQGAAKLMEAYASKRQGEKADQELASAKQKQQMAMADALRRGSEAMRGTPASAGYGGAGDFSDQPAQGPDMGAAMNIFASNPQTAPIASALAQAQIPKKPEPFTLKPDEVRYDANGKPITFGLPKEGGAFSLAPGHTRFDAAGKPIVTAPEDTTGGKPYYTPVPTADGVMSFNNRTGKFEPVQPGTPVVRSQDDPRLQGRLKEGEHTGTEMGKYVGDVQADAAKAAISNRYLDNMQAASKDIALGKLAPAQSSLIQWAQAAGIPVSEEDKKAAGSIQALNSMAIKMAGQATRQSDAQPSQMQYFKILESMPNVSRTPEGFNSIMSYLRDANAYNIYKHEQLTQWRQAHGGSAEGFEAQWPKMADSLPLVWNQQKRATDLKNIAKDGAQPQGGLPGGVKVKRID